MRKLFVCVALGVCLAGCQAPEASSPAQPESPRNITLPAALTAGSVSLEETLSERRSVREYSGEALDLQELSQLLWAAQGMTADWGGRTAPSAGALYPLELYAIAARVDGLDAGAYRYLVQGHELVSVRHGDLSEDMAAVSLGQGSVRSAAAVLVISAVYERTTVKYGERGMRYVHMEAGHAAQNVCLQVTALRLGCVVVGAFDEEALGEVLGLPPGETPLYLIPVGRV